MSHLKERNEKNCLNCNAIIDGRYCAICGQENIEPKESLGHLISHFFQDITHFDGKFFSSLKLLLFHPGFLSREYSLGRRASYLHPIRMYVFTSALFFLLFFSFYQKEELNIKVNNNAASGQASLLKSKNSTIDAINQTKDSTAIITLKQQLKEIEEDIQLLRKDSTATDQLKSVKYSFNAISLKTSDASKKYTNVHQYDSAQKQLPSSQRDSWLVAGIEKQNLYLKEKYHNDGRAIIEGIMRNFIHRFPQMLFLSLPLFAFALWLLYIRRKRYYYVQHAIFSIHLYCANFILILINLWIGSIFGWFGKESPSWITAFFTLAGFFYFYKALRNFYGQGRLKTIFKYILLLFISLLLMSLLFLIFIIFSTFTA